MAAPKKPVDPRFEGRRAKQEEMARLAAMRASRDAQATSPRAPSFGPAAGKRAPDPRFEGRAAKKAEEEAIRARRASELARAVRDPMRGAPPSALSGQRRATWTPEPSLSEKMSGVFGEGGGESEKQARKDAFRRHKR